MNKSTGPAMRKINESSTEKMKKRIKNRSRYLSLNVSTVNEL